MKLLKRSLVLLGCALAATAAFTACELGLGGDDRYNPDAITGIELDYTGAKTTFQVGDTFSSEGVKVNAVKASGDTVDVTAKAEFSIASNYVFTVSDLGSRNVEVTYDGNQNSYPISVTQKITGITIEKEPTVKVGITYTAPNLNGLEIKVNYEGGEPDTIKYSEHPGDFKTEPEKFTKAGTNVEVKVVYLGEFKASYTMEEVKEVTEAAAAYALDGTDDGVKIQGKGEYVADDTFGKVFKNDGSELRANYLLLPADTLQHSAESKKMTIGFWVNANGEANTWNPLFTAYHQKNTPDNDFANGGYPFFYIESRMLMAVNCDGFSDFTETQSNFKAESWPENWNTGYNAWKDTNWHYFTAVITETTAEIYIDGEKIVGWEISGSGDGNVVAGLFTNAGEIALSYVCLGGNQAFAWVDNDAPYSFAKFSVWDTALNEEQIKAVVAAK